MKAIKISSYLILVLVTFVLGCSKKKDLINENNKWVFPDPTDVAYMRIIHSHAANAPSLMTGSTTGPQLFIYLNSQKLNGTSLSYAGAWPTTSVYAAVPAGLKTYEFIMARMNTATPSVPAPVAGDTIARAYLTTVAGKYYSLYLVDTFPALTTMMTEDPQRIPANGFYSIRLVNTTANATDTLNLFSRLEQRNIISNIKHKNSSNFVELPLPLLSDTLEVRKNGTTVAAYFVGSQTLPQSFSPTGKRIYTVVARGKNALTGKTTSASLIANY